MEESLRILVLEDNPADAELIQFELQEAGFTFDAKVVMSEDDFVRNLYHFSPDLILSDYDLPSYNGALALVESRKRCPEIPFILVTGAVSEDRAIEILTRGAKDYVLKSRLEQRLAPAVRRALSEAEDHRARKHAEHQLREAHDALERQVAAKTADLQKEIERRIKIEEDLRRYNERLEILSYTAGRLLESDDPQRTVEELCRKVMTFLDCDVFFNFLADEAAGRLRLNAASGIPAEVAQKNVWLEYGTAVCGCAARDRCRIVAENIRESTDVRTKLVKSLGIQAYACHPLMERNRVLGTLGFGTRSRTAFSDEDLAMMNSVADQVAIALARIDTEKALRAALAKAEEGERFLKAIMDHIPEGIAIAEPPDLKIRMVSRYGQEMLGGPHEGMTVAEVLDQWKAFDKGFGKPVAAEDLPLYRAILKGKTVINEEIVQVNAQGRSLPLLCNAAPIRDSAGTITGGVVAWRDITELHRMEAELKDQSAQLENSRSAAQTEKRYLEAVMEAIPVGIALTDLEGGVIRANAAYEEIWGRPLPEAKTMEDYGAYRAWWAETGKPVLPGEWAAAQALTKGTTVLNQLLKIVRADGSQVTVLNSAAPVLDKEGKILGAVAAIRDITIV